MSSVGRSREEDVARFLPPSPVSSDPADPGPPGDPPLDLEGAAAAARRGWRLVVTVTLAVTVIVLAVSLLADARYRTTARIAESPVSAEAFDVTAADRRLATSRELLTSPAVLGAASRRLPPETAASLAPKVSASVDTTAGLLEVEAKTGDPAQAARIANVVAATFVAEIEQQDAAELASGRELLAAELERQAGAGADAAMLDALRQRLSELTVTEVTGGAGLRLVERAAVPTSAYAPQPLRSTILAFVGALLCGVLLAVAHDRRRTRPPDAAELSSLVGVPLIAALPPAAGRRDSWTREQALVEETALQAVVREALPPDDQHVVLIHGLGSPDDVVSVGAGLVRALGWAGHPAVLVELAGSGDASRGSLRAADDMPVVRCVDHEDGLDELGRSLYHYLVLLDPGVSESQRLSVLGGESTAVLLVARLGRATPADAAQARRLLGALGLHGLGLVVTATADEARAIGPDSFHPAAPAPPRWDRTARTGNGDRRQRLDVSISREPS